MRVMAICSCPRLGYMDFAGKSVAAFYQNGVDMTNAYGVYWHQSLSKAMKVAVEAGYDYIITCDYDSIFDGETVAQLIRLADQNPQADAITTMQMGRFSGLLVSTESGYTTRKELKENALVRVKTGHFGLTLLRAESLKKLKKPWFWSRPDDNGEWIDKESKEDEDTHFWLNFDDSGLNLYLAPRLVIGHLELLIKWPADNLDGIYETLGHYHEFGKPSDCWK